MILACCLVGVLCNSLFIFFFSIDLVNFLFFSCAQTPEMDFSLLFFFRESMGFSEDWKNLMPISSIHSPPLLLSGSSTKTFGPAVFTPIPQTLTPLFSSPSISLPISPPPHPPDISLLKSLKTLTQLRVLVSNEFSSQSDETDPVSNNTLSMLKCPGNDFLIFFPTGENSDQVGFVKLSMRRKEQPEVKVDKDGEVFTSDVGFNFRIHKLLDTSSGAAAAAAAGSVSGHSITVGFLLACTLILFIGLELILYIEKPALVHLGMRQFCSSVMYACWSPHLVEESVILLENGKLILFEMNTSFEAIKLPMKLKGTRVKISWDKCDLGVVLDRSDLKKGGGWLSCEFG